MAEDLNSAQDKTRPCPTCRMLISVLATRCRFCGAEVGRPRDEGRNLTVEDLGGEVHHHYAVSSNVMEALEAFRAETATPAPEGKGRRGRERATAHPGPRSANDGLPALDDKSKALASLAMPGRPRYASTTPRRRLRALPWRKYAAVLAAVVATVLVLYFGGGYVIAKIRGYNTPKDTTPVVVNRALAMLKAGRPVEEALEAAVTARNQADTEENREILAKVRAEMARQIRDILNAPQDVWNVRDLIKATELSAKADRIDPCDDFRSLRAEVEDETYLYNMMLAEVHPAGGGAGTAVFKLNSKDNPRYNPRRPSEEVTVARGDLVSGRFKVLSINRESVRVADTRRNNRNVTYDLYGAIK